MQSFCIAKNAEKLTKIRFSAKNRKQINLSLKAMHSRPPRVRHHPHNHPHNPYKHQHNLLRISPWRKRPFVWQKAIIVNSKRDFGVLSGSISSTFSLWFFHSDLQLRMRFAESTSGFTITK